MKYYKKAFITTLIMTFWLSASLVWGNATTIDSTSPGLIKTTQTSSLSSKASPEPSIPFYLAQSQPGKDPSSPMGPRMMTPPTQNEIERERTRPMMPERRFARYTMGMGTTNMEVKDFDGDDKPDIIILRGSQLLIINNKGNIIMNMILPEPPEKP